MYVIFHPRFDLNVFFLQTAIAFSAYIGNYIP